MDSREHPESLTPLESGLAGLAREHGLTVIEEPGFTGPCYRLMSRKDADQYMALVYGHQPLRLH